MLMWVVTGLGSLALAAAYLGYPELDPVDPDLPVDAIALALTGLAAVLLFVATSVGTATSMSSWRFWTPFVAGLLTLVVLIRQEHHRDRPLMPGGELATPPPGTGAGGALGGGGGV